MDSTFKKLTKKSIEEKLQKLINQYKLEEILSVEKIKDWIFNDYGDSVMDASNRFQKKFFHYFKDVRDIDKIFKITTDAWNVFPHKSLNNKSPKEMVLEAIEKDPSLKKQKSNKKPDFIVGGKKILWDKYWAMIKKMEEMQRPFKQQIEKEILPLYKKFLTQEKNLSKEIVEEYMKVADIFFERVLHVGFLSFEMIRPEFAKYEFPRWWQIHILFDERDENEIWSSLKVLISFLKEKFGLEMKGQ
ncbi:MAG: hypothetical protein WBC21_04410 [Minisyncoccales bacterium]